jgi:hypothetical protein
MKRIALTLAFFTVFSAGILSAQSTQLDLEAEQIDLSKVDLSSAEFFFQGPLELYVDNVQYGNKEYAAILHYDGENTVTVKAPEEVTRENKPERVDVSDASLTLSDGKIVVKGLKLDGGVYRGTFAYAAEKRAFTLVEAERTGAAAAGADASAQELREENKTLTRVVDEQEEQIESLEEKLAKKDRQVVDLNRELRKLRGDTITGLDEVTSRVNELVLENPERSVAQYGSWSLRDGRYRQTDSDMLYAKRVIPAVQSGREQLYSFKGVSNSNGWRGFGLHFLASDVDPATKYGLGTSYLVWITRDSEFYHTGKTYVQIYRSDAYFDMVQLASNAVQVDSNEMNQYHVYVNHDEGTITVFADGRKVCTYEDEQMISEGTHVALRSLGSAEFADLKVFEKQ